jgi:hypothetical protein
MMSYLQRELARARSRSRARHLLARSAGDVGLVAIG